MAEGPRGARRKEGRHAYINWNRIEDRVVTARKEEGTGREKAEEDRRKKKRRGIEERRRQASKFTSVAGSLRASGNLGQSSALQMVHP